MKKVICLVLSLMMLLSIMAGLDISVQALESDRLLCVDWNNIKQVGHQGQGTKYCSVFALAYCRTMLDNKPANPYDYWTDGDGAHWGWGDYSSSRPQSRQATFKAIYDSLNNNRPAIVCVVPGNPEHFVAIVGYQHIKDLNNMSEENFIMIDPYPYNNEEYCTRSLNERYTISKDSKGYWVATANNGSVSLEGVNTPVYNYIIDNAGLLTTSQKNSLENEFQLIRQRYHFDVVFVSTNNLEGKTAQDYADDFYDYNGYGYGPNHDGCLLLYDMSSRYLHISTCGFGITALTDAGLEYLIDKIVFYAKNNEWYDSIKTYATCVNAFVLEARISKPYDINYMPADNNGWKQYNKKWYYFRNGFPVRFQQTINRKLYYFNGDYQMYSGWLTISGKHYYFGVDGAAVKYRQTIGGKLYYFNGAGVMQKGFITFNDGKTCYFGNNGAAVQYTQFINGKRYYFNSKYEMYKGWLTISGKKYYFGKDGAALKYLQYVGKKRYYFNGNGQMMTGWLKISGTWFYFTANGAATGWRYISGEWYYFNDSGSMRTANLTQGGKTYRFNSSGACLNP